MDDNRILRKLVEVGNRLDEDGGDGGHGDELARSNRLEGGKKRVGVLAN